MALMTALQEEHWMWGSLHAEQKIYNLKSTVTGSRLFLKGATLVLLRRQPTGRRATPAESQGL